MAVTSALVDNATRIGSTGTTSTITGAAFGTAASGRVLVVPFIAEGGAVPTAATIGGVSATITGPAALGLGFGLASAIVATGTSGDIVFTFSASDTVVSNGVVALTGASGATPSATLSGTNTIDVGAGGSVIALAEAGSAQTWTGVTGLRTDTSLGVALSTGSFDNSGSAITGRTVNYGSNFVQYAAAFSASGGGTNVTLAAGAGSYSLTGTAATLKRGRKVAATSGSYALTGTAAKLHKGKKLAATAGSYSLTGTAAGLKRGFKVAASAGSYSLTGSAATLKRGLKVTATAGSYSLTGTDAALTHVWKIAAAAGSYSVAGTDATLTIHSNKTLTAGIGSYALTGQDAGLKHAYVLAPAAGSYALTGSDATLIIRSQKALTAGAGSYLVSGQDASLVRTLIIGASPGAYILTGSDVALTVAGSPPEPALDFAPGGYYPWLDRRSEKAKKDIERAEELIEEAPKVVAKAISRIKERPEALISEPLIATITEALTRAHEIASEIAGDLAALQRKQMADAERKRAIRAAKALLDEIEAMEREEEEVLALLLAS